MRRFADSAPTKLSPNKECCACRALLEEPIAEARGLAQSRLPTPRIIECDAGGSQVPLALLMVLLVVLDSPPLVWRHMVRSSLGCPAAAFRTLDQPC